MLRVTAAALAALAIMALPIHPMPAVRAGDSIPSPVLAYYYIWFTGSSWDRAKSDLPLLGKYSSDDAAVMRSHIEQAKNAGIDGFIVSWKSTSTLNQRLDQLVGIAREMNFKLAIIYQGLDFYRDPIGSDHVLADIAGFLEKYSNEPVFQIFDRPLVIWSGTWEYTTDDIVNTASQLRPRCLLLSSERDVNGIDRLGGSVDGNAYYWSSVDPVNTPGYGEKLQSMSDAVHAVGGLWIAPAAPGFDARLLDGTRVIERNDGETLRLELTAALASEPDAIGLISWNEFSENSHVEPSVAFGARYLDVLREYTEATPGPATDFMSDEPQAAGTIQSLAGLLAVGIVGLVSLLAVGVLARRALRRQRDEKADLMPKQT